VDVLKSGVVGGGHDGYEEIDLFEGNAEAWIEIFALYEHLLL